MGHHSPLITEVYSRDQEVSVVQARYDESGNFVGWKVLSGLFIDDVQYVPTHRSQEAMECVPAYLINGLEGEIDHSNTFMTSEEAHEEVRLREAFPDN